MVFKCGPGKLSKYLSINPFAELVDITIELKVHNIQIITIDFNGINNLFSRIVCNFLSFSASLVRFYGLV